MIKTAFSTQLGKFHRNLGSVSGDTAPSIFKGIGGPVTGSLVQGAAMALPAYGLRRALGWLREEDPKESRRRAAILAALGVGGGFLLNSPQLLQNMSDPDKGINWNVGKIATAGLQKRAFSTSWQSPPVVNRERYIDNIPLSYTRGQLMRDNFMSSDEKVRAMMALDLPQKSGLVSWNDVARGAVGAGLGYVGGDLFGRALSVFFGRMEPKTQRTLQNAGAVAGVLRNTGVLQ
jgi:hypothetical protein